MTLTPGRLTIATSDVADYVTLSGAPASKVYDGEPIAAGAAAAADSNGHSVKVEYQKADGSWTEDPAEITATAVADSTTVSVRASVPGYYDGYVEATEALTVTKRAAVVNTESASKYYDGTPLTAGGSISLVGDETASVATSDSQTDVGLKLNKTYEVTWNGTAKVGNYSVVDGAFGTLEVKAQSIVPDPENPDSYKGVEISSPSNVTYDGEAHKWSPTVTDKEGTALKEGVDYEVSYDTSDFTNVTGAITVTITGKGNYAGTATRVYQITPAAYSVVTESASRAYDGSELMAPGKVEGLVNDDDATFATTGAQTQVGSSLNTYTLDFASEQMAKNYTLASEEIGTLTITASGAMAVAGTNYTGVYDGASHGVAAVPTVTEGTTVEYSVDGGDTWNAEVPQVKNVSKVEVTVRATNPNYEEAIANYILEVTPAALYITTGASTKVYDGTALTNGEVNVSGLAQGDNIDVVATGSQTQVGSSQNTYSIDWLATLEGNYTVTFELGTLTVSAAVAPVVPAGPVDPVTPPTPIDTVVTTLEDIVAPIMGDEPTEEEIDADGNPLAGTESHEHCWVHVYMIFFMVVTALYGLLVMLRRGNHTRKINDDMNNVLGGGNGDNEKDPIATNQPAGMEA